MQIYCGEKFPQVRHRRSRLNQSIRDLTSENHLIPQNLILPIFIIEGTNQTETIQSLPDIYRYTLDLAIKRAQEAKQLGIKAIMLFCVCDQKNKNPQGREAINQDNLMCRSIKAIKNAVPEILVIADVALDPYTSHGHDGIIDDNLIVKNDETIEILCQQSLIQAKAGCDIISPSDMMDGRILHIRQTLDSHGFQNVSIMSYSAKYSSNLYGPFRQAVGSEKNLLKADKKNYQMDFRNSQESLREIAIDIQEGADQIIIKPATFYLDIIMLASQNFTVPIYAYHVSGEFASLKFLAKNTQINFEELYYENLISIKRAGATGIISYGAIEILKYLNF
jgi:porphobilinogen synthase